jgi:CBS domain-containing protein
MGIESIPVSTAMTRNVITETQNQNLQAVCKLMNENNIGSVVIVKDSIANIGKKANSNNNNKEAVGIITERDVVRLMGLLQPHMLSIPVRDLMSKPIITLSPNNSIKDAIRTMQLNNIRRILIMERGRIEGITTSKDVFKAIINTRTLIPDLFSVSGQPQMEQRTLFDQFSDYWFSDVLPKR